MDLDLEARLDLLDKSSLVVFVDGEVVLEEGGPPSDAMYVVRKGSIELERDGDVLDVLEPGESFGYPSLLSGAHPSFDVRARGSTTCLRIDRATAERLFGSGPGLRFLVSGLRERAGLAERHDPGGLLQPIELAPTLDALTQVLIRVPDTIAGLRDEGFDAVAIGRAVSRLLDAGTSRAIDLTMDIHGRSPVPWAWLAFGSIARREPGLAPDQDHTVVWEGDAGADGYFEEIAQAVTSTLAGAGLPPCPSGVLATSPGWRGPIDRWIEALLAPGTVTAQSTFLLALALDLRKVAGSLKMDDHLRDLTHSVRGTELGWRIARLAAEVRPPVGQFGGLVTERLDDRRVLDLKQGGLLAVTDLARVAAIRCGSLARSTHGRLTDAVAGGSLDHDEARDLRGAFETFGELRIDRQIACHRRGAPIDSLVEPAALGSVSRSRLRQAFRVVDAAQGRLRGAVGGGRFG